MFGVELLVVLVMMVIGARYGGVFFGIAGGVGLAIYYFIFKHIHINAVSQAPNPCRPWDKKIQTATPPCAAPCS